ncbi:hypothetical protein [Streptomyces collinus]|uniref:hypothetical protein n=1 Tax=Streptomyces collinus TaxID=42684 RepID=UPI00130D9BC8
MTYAVACGAGRPRGASTAARAGRQQRGDQGRLPGQQHRRPVEEGAGAVQPVGDPPGECAGHHPAERAAEQRDRRAAEAARAGARVRAAALEVGDDGGRAPLRAESPRSV